MSLGCTKEKKKEEANEERIPSRSSGMHRHIIVRRSAQEVKVTVQVIVAAVVVVVELTTCQDRQDQQQGHAPRVVTHHRGPSFFELNDLFDAWLLDSVTTD